MIRRLEQLSYVRQTKKFGIVQPMEEKDPGSYCSLPVPKGDYKKAGEGLLTSVYSNRTWKMDLN